jgi:sterol desaturase/sphingolipid hydroxylase (fatty acid hydroxylase superfamily)
MHPLTHSMPSGSANVVFRLIAKWSASIAVPAVFVALVLLERRHPLRRQQQEPARRRVARNLAVAALTAGVIQLMERPLLAALTAHVERRGLGLLPGLKLPRTLEVPLAIVLLDYSLYWWHVMLHRVPCLWRLHLVHHSDPELDVSTAVRFHFGEFIASIPFRALQARVIGVGPSTLALWQRLTLLEVFLHHSNLRIPVRFERWMGRLLVTPRMHGIHHSVDVREMGSNFSSGLSAWDLLHGTARFDVPQETITIGAPCYRDPRHLRLGDLLLLPVQAGSARAAHHAESNAQLSSLESHVR